MGFVRKVTGQDSADRSAKAALESSEIQTTAATEAADRAAQAGQDASALFDPYAALGQTGVDQAGFLTDSQAQYDFLQDNPLFQGALDNANQQTLGLAAARGRLSSGDTLTQLSNNTLLSASPLIADQKASINNLLGIGQNTAANQGNLITSTAANQNNFLTGAAASESAGLVGAANAKNAGDSALTNLTMGLGGSLIGAAGSALAGPLGGAITSGITSAFSGTGTDAANTATYGRTF